MSHAYIYDTVLGYAETLSVKYVSHHNKHCTVAIFCALNFCPCLIFQVLQVLQEDDHKSLHFAR